MMSSHAANSASVLRSAVRLNIGLLVMLAAMPLLAPGSFLRGFGIADTSYAVMGLVRVYIAFALVLAIVLWGARDWLQSAAGRATVRSLTVGYAVAALFLLGQQWTVWYGRSGLALMFGCAVLALKYARALRVEPAILAPTA